jgi:hypothetical protein
LISTYSRPRRKSSRYYLVFNLCTSVIDMW